MATNREFKVGDIVVLKSGGPNMTIKSIPTETGTSYTCQWFAGKKLEQGVFPENSIKKVEAS
jgi:uncharacterized protein YodC (DUF2158 family)